jgi:hypothetical protein
LASRPAASSTPGFAVQVLGLLREAVLGYRLGEEIGEGRLDLVEVDAVLRPLGTRERRVDGRQVELDGLRVLDVALLRNAVHALRLVVRGEGFDFLVGAAGAAEVLDRLVVDGEEAHRRAVLGRHVGDGRAVRDGERLGALAEELDELADDLGLAQHFRDRQHKVRGGDRRVQLAFQVHADDVGRQEVDRLAEHAGFGLDAAAAPAHHADAVDHGRVAVGADQRIGIAHAVLGLVDASREIFEVHLVDDADARRDDLERVEGLHAPLHELVALLVALEFQLHVQVERVLVAEVVDLHRVVDDQVHRHQRLDHLRVVAHLRRHAAHRGEIAEQRHAGKVLKHDARHDERNLLGALGRRLPVRQLLDVRLGDFLAVAVPEHRFEHDADGDRQPRDVDVEGLAESRQRIELAALEGLKGVVQVMRH